MNIPANYLEKIYAGFLGKAIGVRLGAPVEPAFWTHDRIERVYGDIRGYVKSFSNFAADDDTNGPVFFVRALEDYCQNRELQASDVGNAWLNYTAEGHGMFWWGGYGISTEHTAYLNLKNGIAAPQSGSMAQNGATLAEQIGGQIFIDSWGLVWPCNVQKAAEYAWKAAQASHDGNGVYGGMFNAACIAKAFETEDIRTIVAAGLSVVPPESEFMRVNRAVLEFHDAHPDDFRACFKMLERDFGYDKYRGICHMIPNAGVVTLALLYGAGSLSRTVEIATMCGWDTDCNAGNAGTIAGVAYGLDGVENHYRRPINDMIVASSVCGSLNIVDIPSFARSLARIGYRLAGEGLPDNLREAGDKSALHFDFELPGSTHGFRLNGARGSNQLENVLLPDGRRCLRVSLNDHRRNDCLKVYVKPFYRRADFDDERYLPMFSPQVYPGQKLRVRLRQSALSGEEIMVSLYARGTHSKTDRVSDCRIIGGADWQELEWKIPADCEAVDEIGVVLENSERGTYIGCVDIDEMSVSGAGVQVVNFSREKEEFNAVTQFTYNRGKWTIEDGLLQGLGIEDAECFSGNYYARDYEITTTVLPQCGASHTLAFRAKGLMMGYNAGFDGTGQVSIIKNDHGRRILASTDFEWRHGQSYDFRLTVRGNRFVFAVNGTELLTVEDEDAFEYGMYGFALLSAGRCLFDGLRATML